MYQNGFHLENIVEESSIMKEDILFAIQKLRKEEEICRLKLELLEMERKTHTAQYKKIKRLRGDKCFQRVMLEKQLRASQKEAQVI